MHIVDAHDGCSLVADIGGTNARFALFQGDNGKLHQLRSLACRDYSDLASAIEAYLLMAGVSKPGVQMACIAVATAVTGDEIKLTNNSWSFSCTELRQRFDWQSLRVINDFSALALSLPLLAEDELQQVGGGAVLGNSPKALLGPGTGLGVSGLIPVSKAAWVPLQGEGGHVTCNGTNLAEATIIDSLRRYFSHISAERLLSGPGLENLYQAICVQRGETSRTLSAEQITHHALQTDDAICVESLALFCRLLGNVAGNLALTLGARGGVYIGGGIVPKLGDYFFSSGFRQAFEQHGRCEAYLQAIPCYVVHSKNAALRGAAQVLQQDYPYLGYRV